MTETNAQQVSTRSASRAKSGKRLMMNIRQFRRAQRLAIRAVQQRSSKKWDVANRIMARATGVSREN
ncbi:hypothetical protein ACS25C_03870 [Dickeya undicola]|uniref:hypothetical protein n=1 Tax=Dickeya undicola TaxID=1577887 RepID=UPI003F207C5D